MCLIKLLLISFISFISSSVSCQGWTVWHLVTEIDNIALQGMHFIVHCIALLTISPCRRSVTRLDRLSLQGWTLLVSLSGWLCLWFKVWQKRLVYVDMLCFKLDLCAGKPAEVQAIGWVRVNIGSGGWCSGLTGFTADWSRITIGWKCHQSSQWHSSSCH